MNKIITSIAAVAICAAVSAEIVKNPDPNTLWIENGKNMKLGPAPRKCWGIKGNIKSSAAENGFKLGPSGTLGTYVPVSSQYPWYCFKVVSVERVGSGYHALSTNLNLNIGIFSIVSKIPKGIYCISMEGAKKLKEKPFDNYMRFDIHSANITFEYLGMFKEPPCKLSFGSTVIKKGSNATITITTKEPAEMVQLKFYKAYTMPAINVIPGVKRYLAKPVDGKGNKEWTFSFPYNGFKGVDGKIGSIVIEAVVETKDEVQSYIFFNQIPFEK